VQTIDELIGESPVFAGLERERIALIAGCAGNVRFEANEELFREGDPADTFYLVRRGTIALETFVPARGALTIETLGPGEVVGWSWLIPPYEWHFDARAVGAVRAIGFDGACLRDKCAADPALGFELLTRFAAVLLERLQATRVRLLDVYGSPALR
jgi:CRP/FNR family transcriptional regulator, cyclic AMP receptor protein